MRGRREGAGGGWRAAGRTPPGRARRFSSARPPLLPTAYQPHGRRPPPLPRACERCARREGGRAGKSLEFLRPSAFSMALTVTTQLTPPRARLWDPRPPLGRPRPFCPFAFKKSGGRAYAWRVVWIYRECALPRAKRFALFLRNRRVLPVSAVHVLTKPPPQGRVCLFHQAVAEHYCVIDLPSTPLLFESLAVDRGLSAACERQTHLQSAAESGSPSGVPCRPCGNLGPAPPARKHRGARALLVAGSCIPPSVLTSGPLCIILVPGRIRKAPLAGQNKPKTAP